MPAGQQGPYATMHNHTHHAHDDTWKEEGGDYDGDDRAS